MHPNKTVAVYVPRLCSLFTLTDDIFIQGDGQERKLGCMSFGFSCSSLSVTRRPQGLPPLDFNSVIFLADAPVRNGKELPLQQRSPFWFVAKQPGHVVVSLVRSFTWLN